MSKRSRDKGKRGERELAEVLREHGWNGARRGQQRSGLDQADVVGGPPGWHFECKRVEKLALWPAWEQATRDAKAAGAGAGVAVVTRRNSSPWLAVVELRVLLRLIGHEEEALRAFVADVLGAGGDSPAAP